MLRWISLVALLVLLAVFGDRRLHLHNFVLFLVLVLGLAAAVVAVYMATSRGGREDTPG